jgi:CheY-like chemotaxis protein
MQIQERYILMLEDDHDDRYFTSAVMQELDIVLPIKFLSNTDLLFSTLEEGAPLLIVMDYNLHPETGLEVLQKIRRHPSFQHIPVVVLGDIKNPDFVAKCYLHGANTYVTKPTTIEATKFKIELFFKYWLEVAETPSPLALNKMHEANER